MAAACVLALGAGAVWLASTAAERSARRAAHPQVNGSIALAGLGGPVRIDRNRHGVPQVEARSERDAFLALGFCHAQDRLGQLLHLRRRARGTAAEVLGAEAVDADRVSRLVDFSGLADRQWERLPAAARSALEAYSAGVNARIDRLDPRAVPAPEGEASAIEPWRPQDSLALFKLFAWNLGASVDVGLVLHALLGELGAAEAGRFFPPRPAGGGRPGRIAAALPPWLGAGLADLRRAGGLEGQGVGSTAFALGGAHSESGHALLVADHHFTPTAPAALYFAHLRGPGLDVAGATLVGVPVFWSGRNPKLAWAGVHTGTVVTDLYVETLRREGAEYHDGRRWRPVKTRSEVIAVRGGADVELTVRRTARGLLLPWVQEATGEAISLAWTGARIDGASGIASLLAVARSPSGAALRRALASHREPVVAVVWAEAAGGVGLQIAGWIPRRSLAAQLLPLPGRAPWYQWKERVPFEDLPTRELAGGQGFLVAADQPFQSGAGAPALDAVWRPGVRAGRLERELAALSSGRVDLRRLAALQTDAGLPRSLELAHAALTLAGDALPGEEARELAALLRGWDGSASAESTGCAAYHVFLDLLARALFAERLGPLYDRYLALPSVDLEGLVLDVLRDAAGGGADGWSDPERVRAAVEQSLRGAWLGLSFRLGPDPRRWLWGTLHPLRFRNPADPRAALDPIAYGGAPHALLAASYSAARPFDVEVAATARFAIDLGAPDLLLTSLAPGQSEHPDPLHFDSGLRDWLAGRHALLATRSLEIEERSVARLVLEPGVE